MVSSGLELGGALQGVPEAARELYLRQGEHSGREVKREGEVGDPGTDRREAAGDDQESRADQEKRAADRLPVEQLRRRVG